MRQFAACTATILLSLSCLALAQEKRSAATNRPCVFAVWLPAAASLEVEGYVTKSRGEFRLFESPPVPVGRTYVYTLRAIHGGIVVTRAIEVSPDKQTEIDLRPDFGIPVPAQPQKKPEPQEKATKPAEQKTESKPPSKQPSSPAFTIHGFRDVVVAVGGTATLRVSVQRQGLDSLISLEFSGLPKGVTFSQSTIPANADHLDLTIRAAADTAPGKYAISVTAKTPAYQQVAKFTILVVEEVKVKPALPPVAKPAEKKTSSSASPDDRKSPSPGDQPAIQHPLGFLAVAGPELITLSPGQSAKVVFKVWRKAVTGEVHFRWISVPESVSAPSATLKSEEDTAVMLLTVAADAAPLSRDCRLQVATAGGAIRLEIPVRVEIR